MEKNQEANDMGKIVKFCSKCEESFDNKFSFCPNCAESLEAFEMKPVTNNETAKVSETPIAAASESMEVRKPEILSTAENEVKTVSYDTGSLDDDILELDVEGSNGSGNPVEMPSEDKASFEADSFETDEVETIVSTTPVSEVDSATPTNFFDEPVEKYGYRKIKPSGDYLTEAGDNFHITVIQEKNVKERNFLFMGAAALILTLAFGGLVYSIFDKDLDLAAIDGDSLISLVPDLNEEPMQVDEELKPEDDNDSGGGGGGNNNPKPVSKGQYAQNMENPMIAPTVTLRKMDSEVKYQAGVKSNLNNKQTNEPYGDPNSTSFDLSDGPGSGGGQGRGLNRGQGDGEGSGLGYGKGGGSGGSGDGPGGRPRVADNKPDPKPDPPKAAGPTTGVKILTKEKPGYTDAARVANVQGTVTLKVTFLASGQIGSVSPISGLGYGLTEKAIAAARSIRFEPAQRNGVPYTTAKTVQFSFTIY